MAGCSGEINKIKKTPQDSNSAASNYIKMKKKITLLITVCCVLTACSPSKNEGIDITFVNRTQTVSTRAEDYTLVLESPEDSIFPRSFLTSYDSDEDVLNYIRLPEGHLWKIEEIGRKTYNYEGGEIDKKIKALKKHCEEKGEPCVFFPYNEQENYPLSFEFCIEGKGSVSFMLYDDTNKRNAPADPENGEQSYWFELTSEGRLFYKTSYGYGSCEIIKETGKETQGTPFLSEGLKADVWNEISLYPVDGELMLKINGKEMGAICELGGEQEQRGGFYFGGSEGVMLRYIAAGNTVLS